MSDPTRVLALDGCYNLRDVGGYPTSEGAHTRWRMLLRADSLHALPLASQQTLLATGVRTVIDLRRHTEVDTAPNVFRASTAVSYIHLPLFKDPMDQDEAVRHARTALTDIYKAALDDHQAELATVLDVVARPDTSPVLVHCAAGKDRTGIVIALLLELLGVVREVIAEDYAMSERCIEPLKAGFRDQAKRAGYNMDEFDQRLQSPQSYILAMLEHLDNCYGGARSFARHIGITSVQIKIMKAQLLVKS